MGDPACWMHEMCLECGTISEDRGPDDPCPNCGAEPISATGQNETSR
ncbi:MAG TPA: hypothetical protein VF246_09625 [Acidimicrobiia bacterium]